MRNPLRTAFCQQRIRAKERCVSFEMTFEEWLCIWDLSGKLHLRGRGFGKYVMARYGDVGPYSVSNVEIVSYSQNAKDAHVNKPRSLFDLRSKQIGSGRGWTFVDGKYQVTVSKKYIGRFATEQEAIEAYKHAADALLTAARCMVGNPLALDERGGVRE